MPLVSRPGFDEMDVAQFSATSPRASSSASARPPGNRLGKRAGLDGSALTRTARNPGESGAGCISQCDRSRQPAGNCCESLTDQDQARWKRKAGRSLGEQF